MTNPTMKRTAKVESKDDAKNLALIQQFNDLENKWKSQEKRRRRCSTASDSSSTTTNTIISFDHLFQSSPRTLMSSLQHRKPALRLNNCSNNAIEEILMDRRAAITSGRFKGRQLFAAAEVTGDGGGEICSDWLDGIEEREVIMNFEGSISGERRWGQYELFSDDLSEYSCSFPEEKMVVEVAGVAEKGGGDGRRKEKGGGRRVVTASLGILLVLIVFAVFISMDCNGNNNVEELILVPT